MRINLYSIAALLGSILGAFFLKRQRDVFIHSPCSIQAYPRQKHQVCRLTWAYPMLSNESISKRPNTLIKCFMNK